MNEEINQVQPTPQVPNNFNPKNVGVIIGVVVLLIVAGLITFVGLNRKYKTVNPALSAQQPIGTQQQSQPTNNENTNTSTSTSIKIIESSFATPAYLDVLDNSLELVEQNKTPVTLVSYANESLYLADISPDKNYVVIQHFNGDRDGYVSHFGSGKTGLALISLHPPYTVKELVQPAKQSHSDFTWSPDSRYIAYITNDGDGLEIRDVGSNQVVLSFKSQQQYGGGAQPLSWLDQNQFSYILDKSLYIGSLANPREKLVASDADNSVCNFESPTTFLPLDWSPDKKYVSYQSTSSLVILDTTNNKKYKFGSLSEDEGYCGAQVTASGIGWRNQNQYFFTDDSGLKSVTLPSGIVKNYSLLANPGEDTYGTPNVSDDGNYVGILGNRPEKPGENGKPWTARFYDLSKPDKRCMLETYFYPFVDNKEHTWEKNSYALLSGTVVQGSSKFGIQVVDLNTCEKLGTLSGAWLKYNSVINKDKLPGVLDIVNEIKKP